MFDLEEEEAGAEGRRGGGTTTGRRRNRERRPVSSPLVLLATAAAAGGTLALVPGPPPRPPRRAPRGPAPGTAGGLAAAAADDCGGGEEDEWRRPRRERQTLLFRDAETGVPVHVVGAMHYNPASVRSASLIVRRRGRDGTLGSVVVESCRKRWDLTARLQPPGSLARRVLDNEFQAAAEAGAAVGVGVVLGDEDVEENNRRINEMFLSSVGDYLNPLGGGWTAISNDLIQGYGESVDPTFLDPMFLDPESGGGDEEQGEEYLNQSDLLDPDLLLGAPVSIARYALALLVRQPLKGLLLVGWVGLLVTGLSVSLASSPNGVITLSLASFYGLVLSLSIVIPLLGRVFLFALLGERNAIIAGSIREECRRLRAVEEGGGDAVPGTDLAAPTENEKVCVAVLGLAHCNGVKRELCRHAES